MQHFDTREAYYDAVDQLIRENRHGLVNAGDIARTTVVSYYGDPDLLTLGTCDPDLETGWCPMSILEQSAQNVEDVLPERAEKRHHVPVSDAAYYALREDIEARAGDVLAEPSEVSGE